MPIRRTSWLIAERQIYAITIGEQVTMKSPLTTSKLFPYLSWILASKASWLCFCSSLLKLAIKKSDAPTNDARVNVKREDVMPAAAPLNDDAVHMMNNKKNQSLPKLNMSLSSVPSFENLGVCFRKEGEKSESEMM